MTVRDLKNKRVTVMGLGRLGGGVGIVKFLAERGAKLIVTDIKQKEELSESLEQLKKFSGIEFVLGQHRKEDFIDRDLIIKNPGVSKRSPYLQIARDKGIPIQTDVGLFLQLSTASIIGITGTKGKSTTASLLYELLKKNYTTFLAGNIGKSPLDILSKADANSLVVLELSSWQLEDLTSLEISPHVAVILNIYPDHLNRHPDFSDYISAKKVIFQFQNTDDIAVLNYDDDVVRRFSSEVRGKVRFFSITNPVKGVFVKDGHIYLGEGKDALIAVPNIALKGNHNLSNVCAALSVGEIYKIRPKDMQSVLHDFSGISFRQEFIREIHGIKFFNDTTATNPQAAIAAIDRFGPSLILIAGGVDKKLSYTELALKIAQRVKHLILLPGSASEKIKLHLGPLKKSPPVDEVSSMVEAVKSAFQHASSGDTIALSPAAASFNLFQNEFDRGEQFNEQVMNL